MRLLKVTSRPSHCESHFESASKSTAKPRKPVGTGQPVKIAQRTPGAMTGGVQGKLAQYRFLRPTLPRESWKGSCPLRSEERRVGKECEPRVATWTLASSEEAMLR